MLPSRSARPGAKTVAARLAVALVSACLALAAAPAADQPEPPDAQARAVAALPHAQVLGLIAAPPKTISGLGAGAGGEAKSIHGSAADLQSAMADLKARVVGQEIHIELPADVLFDFDKADIRADAAAALAQTAVILRAHPGARVRVDGHTDSKGTHPYNLALSERRAQAVVRWLQQREGLDATAFAAHGLAETKPVAPNTKPDGSDNPPGRQRNRRVEIVVSP